MGRMPRARLRSNTRKTNRRSRNKSRRQLGGAGNSSELFKAIIAGDAEKVKTLLKQDINLLNSRSGEIVVAGMVMKNLSPLAAAAYAGNIDIIHVMIKDLNDDRVLQLAYEKDLKGESPYEISKRNPELMYLYETVEDILRERDDEELEEHIQKNIKSEINNNPAFSRAQAEKNVRKRYGEDAAHRERMANYEY